jgi:hypothetical protein
MRAKGLALLLLVPLLSLAGCGGGSSDKGSGTPAARDSDEAREIREALDKLAPEDRKLAAAQRFCAVETENRLGTMGTPYKLMVKGEPVFLCCKGCQTQALEDPKKTLDVVHELRAKGADASAR